ncbi:AAA family ATPase [Alcaligenes faecalis]|uniref:AAA family ATPase n=1 Tax=Alcaligenes faecalis TaxID=511 RepID=UPI0005A643BC|nr:AAA family ATPase [Alcaligenes faecalis]ATH99186.1 chromosome partitioning protein ParA [Alcaligenes faecalis]AYZ91974.1 ParA family protein [Alcaligenes faecalis]MCX5596349.1 AAA family ATPase [Alcaligenes faecalis]QQC32219.1 AAA family ATPase [Alcaligenes faecalis]CUI99392.1 Sporulation initiation inhibitor protein soj [Alcaligenes faecalis]
MKSIAFFTNKGGVGKTTLTCNLAAYLAIHKGKKILIVDADPQTNATQYMFKDSVLKEIYDKKSAFTIYSMARPLSQGKGYSTDNKYRKSSTFKVDVLLGDPRLALIEDTLAADWNSGGVRGIRTTYMFREFLSKCEDYDYVFFDMGPSLGSINRAVLIACDYFILPLSMDIFSIRATENISTWLKDWKRRLDLQLSALPDADETEISDLSFRLRLLGYVNQQYTAKRDASGERRAVKAYEKIMSEVPQAIEKTLLKDQAKPVGLNYQLGSIPNLHSLIPMSQNSRKPVFELKNADGIVGAHFTKVNESLELFTGIAANFNYSIEVLNDFVA